MPAKLLFSNVPFDCSDEHLKQWIEGRGYPVLSIELIRDAVSGTSPSFAHVQLKGPEKLDEAGRALDGQIFRGRRLNVSRIVRTTAATARARAAGANLR